MTIRHGRHATAAPRDPEAEIARSNDRLATMVADVRDGLARTQKELPPKYFYDERGSELFEEITRLPEYYLTRAERRMLERHAGQLVRGLRPRSLVELGAGSAAKTRILLDAMRSAGCAERYVPVDVSGEFLVETTHRLRTEYPGLRVTPAVADIAVELGLPHHLPHPVLFAFLGSTIGNFDASAAVGLLRRLRRAMGPFDRLLLGADLRKDVAVVEAAYNDAQGVTAEFNRNVLCVLNRELGADFRPAGFEHRAVYVPTKHRIEMHLISRHDQVIRIPAVGDVSLRKGESIRTEISCKYDRASIARMLRRSGMALEQWLAGDGSFGLAIAMPVP